MLFNRDEFRLHETYNIKLNDSVLIKLEDGLRNKEPLLVTVAASHYGMLNRNNVIYRHNTVRHNIGTFIHPSPKPIITNHRPGQSKEFGKIIAVDYKDTEYIEKFKLNDFDSMSSLDYLNFCRDEIIPFQEKNSRYDGLGYCEVVGKIHDEEGIKKVLNGEFMVVSIGADPKRLICSHCLQDQVVSLCDHYADKGNGIFMLAEELAYEELSFLTPGKRPADPFGKVTHIHDGDIEEHYYDIDSSSITSNIDVINARDFFKLADETKTIVCVDNVCMVINQEATMAKKTEQKPTFNVSYTEEFSADQIKDLKLTDQEDEDTAALLTLTDEVVGNLKNSDFAVVQKTEEGIKRRFPIFDANGVKAAAALLDSATDLTPGETLRAKASIEKSAKKLGVEIEFKTEAKEETTQIQDAEIEVPSAVTTETEKTLEAIVGELKAAIGKIEASKLTDAETVKPISFVIAELASLTDSIEWVKEDLNAAVFALLDAEGLVTVTKEKAEAIEVSEATITALQDELAETKEDLAMLDEINRDLNVAIRKSTIDEIIDGKLVIGTLLQDAVDEERAKLVKYPYEVLVDQVNDIRVLKAKLSDNQVINKQGEQITSVIDPTLTDSAIEDGVATPTITDEAKPLDEKELVKAIRDLFRL